MNGRMPLSVGSHLPNLSRHARLFGNFEPLRELYSTGHIPGSEFHSRYVDGNEIRRPDVFRGRPARGLREALNARSLTFRATHRGFRNHGRQVSPHRNGHRVCVSDPSRHRYCKGGHTGYEFLMVSGVGTGDGFDKERVLP